jgi:pyridoxamine 5'-phosphate oxidase
MIAEPEITSLRARLRRLPTLAGPLWPFPTAAAPETPQALFADWLGFAIDAGIREPHAMTLSTVDQSGFPDARTLILKDLDEHWHFASDANGPKGRQLALQPRVALTFYWPRLGRQVRIRGIAERASDEAGAADFRARSPSARAIALIGRQSQELTDVAELAEAHQRANAMVELCPDLTSQSWSLYAVDPVEVEFWQGQTSRCHIRLRYTRAGNGWKKALLWP